MDSVCRTLHSFLTEQASHCPDRKLLGDDQGWISARQTLCQVEKRAEALVSIGIQTGDLVALRAYRSVDTALEILALQSIGAVAVLTDPRQDIDDFFAERGTRLPVVAAVDGKNRRLLRRKITRPLGLVDPKAPGFVIFTSGSTGKAKAVMLSQYNLVNNLLDSKPLGDYRTDDIALGVLPLDHVFGLVLLAGICVLGYGLFFPRGKDVPSLLSTIEQQRITRMNGVPALYLAMAEQSGTYDISSLRAGFIGGGPYTQDQFRRIERVLGMTLIPVYGMSEFVGIACGCHRDSQARRADGVGRFYSMNTGKILLEDGTEALPGQAGEICVDGPAKMVGYYGNEPLGDSLWHTGDLGWLDTQGCLHITGRAKDIIIRNGVNLSPVRIEHKLLEIPGVSDAAVVGLADEKTGELPWAMVVYSGTADLGQEAGKRLPKNEVPVGFCVVDTLPKTAAGKPDKQKIREVLSNWKV